MMGKTGAAAAALLALLPGVGRAGDMQLGVMGSAEYDDNIRRTETDEDDDFVFRVSPHVDFLEDEGHFTWDVGYLGAYERALDYSQIDGFRHFANAGADWNLDERTRFYTENHFSYSEAVDTVTSIESPGSAPILNTLTEPVYRYDTRLGAEHAFTPRLVGNTYGIFEWFESDLPGRSNNRTFGGSGDLRYAVTPLHDLGGGVSLTYQDFDESNGGGRAPQQTLYVNFFGLWDWEIDETTSLSVQAGPAFVDNRQDKPPASATVSTWPTLNSTQAIDAGTCPEDPAVPGQFVLGPGCQAVNLTDPDDITEVATSQTTVSFLGTPPPSLSETSWTAFGSVALSKRWTPDVVSTLSYNRSYNTASGVSGSAVLDYVSLLTTWRITELWSTAVRADFARRESTSSVRQDLLIVENQPLGCTGCSGVSVAQAVGLTSIVVPDSLDTNRWGVSARLARRITENLVVSLRYSYNQQSSKSGTVGSFSDFDDNIVTLGVEYDFDRWRLW